MMKVLFDHPSPFLLAHGGFQIQIEQTKKALLELGIEVEWLRWWDVEQKGDIIHYFGRPLSGYIQFAHRKGMKVVMSELLTGPGSRSNIQRTLQKALTVSAQKLLPKAFLAKMAWDAYQDADAIIALTDWEKQLMIEMFDAPINKLHVVPNGVEKIFFKDNGGPSAERSKWLVCTSTITERKRVVELIQASVIAGSPIWIIGKPYSSSDPYYLKFLEIVRSKKELIRFEGEISDRVRLAEIYKSSRGFVLLSTMESLSLSALEATASGCPLLLTDLPWARSVFKENAQYCPIANPHQDAVVLRNFYESCPELGSAPAPLKWSEVAAQLETIYQGICD